MIENSPLRVQGNRTVILEIAIVIVTLFLSLFWLHPRLSY